MLFILNYPELLLILLSTIFWLRCVIIQEGTFSVKERFGKYHSILHPGVHLMLPFIDSLKEVTWSRTIENGNKQIVSETSNKTSFRSSINDLDFPPYQLYTKDGCKIIINGILYYKIIDPKLAIYAVDDLWKYMLSIIQTTIRDIVYQQTHSDLLNNTELLKNNITCELQKNVKGFGIEVLKVNIQEIIPNDEITKANEKRIIILKSTQNNIEQEKAIYESNLLKQKLEMELALNNAENDKKLKIKQLECELHYYQQLITMGFTPQNIIDLKTTQSLSQSTNTKLVIPHNLTHLHVA